MLRWNGPQYQDRNSRKEGGIYLDYFTRIPDDMVFPRLAVLKGKGVKISMDGKGRWVDNVFVERLWRSVKYEDVYLRAYETPAALRVGLTHYFRFDNTERRHQTLNRRTPDAVYFADPKVKKAA